MPDGQSPANCRSATAQTRREDPREKQEKTESHRVAFFGKLADIAGEYLKKGSPVYVEGRLKTRKWTDKEGKENYTTEIIAEEMKMLGGCEGRGTGDEGGRADERGGSEERQARPPASRPAASKSA